MQQTADPMLPKTDAIIKSFLLALQAPLMPSQLAASNTAMTTNHGAIKYKNHHGKLIPIKKIGIKWALLWFTIIKESVVDRIVKTTEIRAATEILRKVLSLLSLSSSIV